MYDISDRSCTPDYLFIGFLLDRTNCQRQDHNASRKDSFNLQSLCHYLHKYFTLPERLVHGLVLATVLSPSYIR